ncbi:MarR family winged helix-turn-helix transcriptional regulator [Loktanella sp. M215]|uniref:MarR family winged helix-turn-helix transcriptional regulator n=1 Tax=Loktanella sp. M215 TaxID=2675431 RepID=UPI001F42A6A6|nr:MarR family winged helix-turn-helix transcriptional regulator [Loktanella sp. M215]
MSDQSSHRPGSIDPVLYEERIARLIRLAARAFNRSLTLRLATEGVTFGQWIFLRILWREDGLSQRELSARAHLTEPTAHTALSRMDEMGLITRRNTDGNRRRQHAFLTKRGWQLRELLEPLAIEANDLAVEGLTEDDLQVLRKSLAMMIKNLEQDERDAARRGFKVPPTRPQN